MAATSFVASSSGQHTADQLEARAPRRDRQRDDKFARSARRRSRPTNALSTASRQTAPASQSSSDLKRGQDARMKPIALVFDGGSLR
jgi:hypothetical protein